MSNFELCITIYESIHFISKTTQPSLFISNMKIIEDKDKGLWSPQLQTFPTAKYRSGSGRGKIIVQIVNDDQDSTDVSPCPFQITGEKFMSYHYCINCLKPNYQMLMATFNLSHSRTYRWLWENLNDVVSCLNVLIVFPSFVLLFIGKTIPNEIFFSMFQLLPLFCCLCGKQNQW